MQYSRPSIDVLFESAADVYRNRLVGVVLTGANDDGSRGLTKIADHGGTAVVQDPDTAATRVMPEAAMCAVPSARVLALDGICAFLAELKAAPDTGRRRQA